MTSYKKSDLSKALRSHCLIWDIEDVASTISFFIVLISVSVIIVTSKAGVYSFLPILMIVCGIGSILASFACFAGLLSGIEYFYFGPLVVFGIYTFLTLLIVILLLIVLALGANAQTEVMTSLGMSDGVIDVSTQSLTVVLWFALIFTVFLALLPLVIWMSILHHAYKKSSDKNREDFSSRASVGYQSSSVYSKSNFGADNAASRSQTPIASSVQQV